jgi:DNA invertase Pin-like site-specific DNA recombinase
MGISNTASVAVGYLRVSTKRQGDSGLGLDAQRRTVEGYCQSAGLTLARTFTEIESGKRADRPELAAAIAHCKRTGARLVVAKIDRLARNVHFLSGLMAANVDFIAVDNPLATRLTIHILAAVAEAEALTTSARTKAALASAKARGTKLGSARPGHWKGHEDARREGGARGRVAAAKLKKARALDAVADFLPTIRKGRADGLTFAAIAEGLNADGHTTSTGKQWTAVGVIQCMRRFPAGT